MRIDVKNSDAITKIIKSLFNIKLKRKINGITTDSRELKTGDLYIAIEGNINDGHNFLEQVDNLNASAVIINNDKNTYKLNTQIIAVDNPVKAVGEIARSWRENFNIPIVGITGSNGKTSTRELLNHILSGQFNVHATNGNYNTSIGLPITMIELDRSHDISVLEMGANQNGDIKYLCSIAKPTHGLITNISSAHLEGFGSIENIIKTKSALFDALENGISFVNYADDRVKEAHRKGKKITYGLQEECDFPADIHHDSDGSIILTIDSNEINTNSKNLSFAKNVIAVASVCVTLGIDWKYIQEKIYTFIPPKGRCRVFKYNSITVIDDTYNSNLESCSAAIDYLKAFSGDGRYIAVIGDMLELGPASKEQHEKLGEKCSSSNLDAVFTLGNETFNTAGTIRGVKITNHFKEHSFMIKTLKSFLTNNDKVLFKGSRGMQMEKIISGVFDK